MQLLQPALPPALPQLSGLWEAKVLAPLGVQAPPGERHVWAELQLRWSGGEHQVRLHLHFICKSSSSSNQKLKKQAVWVRMHLQGRRGRGLEARLRL